MKNYIKKGSKIHPNILFYKKTGLQAPKAPIWEKCPKPRSITKKKTTSKSMIKLILERFRLATNSYFFYICLHYELKI